jgi:hypothetical protein
LTELNLPDSLEYFGGFYDCTALTSVVIPEGVTEIGDGALANCENLTSVTLPSSVRVIGDRAFSRCYKLESLVIPEGVTEIPQSMVQFCTALSEVVLPSTVTTISTHAFQNCENLTAITLPHGLKSLDYGCFSGSGLTEIIMPASVTSLGAQTFQYCRQLEKAVVHGNVGTSAFEGCSALKQVELKNTVKNLGVWAFKNCTALESITIPGSVTEIQQHCFSNCSGLKEIIFQGDAPQISIMAFETVTATAYYPQDNATWTEDKFQDYKGTLTWVPMAPPCEEHKYTAVITEPTCEAGGYTTYTCSECGHSYVDDYTDPVDHSYEDGHCKWCGKGQAYAKIVSYSTSLGGNIAMNFYVELSEDLVTDPDAYIQFTFAGKTVNVPLSEGILSGTSYRFACPITSKNMTDDITAQVYNADGPVGDPKTMAVDTYCNWIIANTSDQKTINLMKAMLNYGTSAQMISNDRSHEEYCNQGKMPVGYHHSSGRLSPELCAKPQ